METREWQNDYDYSGSQQAFSQSQWIQSASERMEQQQSAGPGHVQPTTSTMNNGVDGNEGHHRITRTTSNTSTTSTQSCTSAGSAVSVSSAQSVPSVASVKQDDDGSGPIFSL